MQYVGVGIGLGYGLGPLLGALIEIVCQAANWDSKAVNSSTAPGWFIAILFVIEGALIWAFMIEPATSGPPGGKGGAPPPTPWARISAAYVVVFCTPINVGMWDVHTATIAGQFWGWSAELSGFYLAGLNIAAVPFGLLPVARFISDRVGMACFAGVAAIATIFFYDYNLGVAAEASVYGVGAVLLLIGAQFMKAFAWGLVSKLPPPAGRPLVMSVNSMMYMFGRGCGAIVGGYVDAKSNFAIVLTALDAAVVIYVVGAWSLLQVPASVPDKK